MDIFSLVLITLPVEASPDLRFGQDIALRNNKNELLAVMTINPCAEYMTNYLDRRSKM